MKPDKFDIYTRDVLEDHETLVNTDKLWENVHAELYPKKKKKFAWVWFSASSFLAIILFSGYAYYAGNTNSIKTDQIIEESINKEQTETAKVNSSKTVDSKLSTNEFKEEKDISTTLSSILDSQKSKAKLKAKTKPRIKNTVAVPSKTLAKQNYKTTKIKATADQGKKTNTSNIKSESNLNVGDKDAQSPLKVGEEKNTDPQKLKANEKTKETKVSKIIADKEELNTNEFFEKTEDEAIAAEESEDESAEESDEESEDDINAKLKRNLKLGFGFRAGISNSLTTLTADGDDAAAELRSLRSQSESNLETIDFGLDVLLKHKSGIYLSTGIDYVKASRKMTFSSGTTSVDSVMGIANIYVNPITMDTTYEEGWIERTTTSFRNKEVYNNLHLINIPLSLGVSLDYEQWTFGIQGGALLNVLVKRKGQIMDSESTFYDLKTDESNWFKDNLGLSFQGTALIGYNFSDNFQIVGGPSFRSPLVLSNDINPIKQSQVGLGLQVSARYWLD